MNNGLTAQSDFDISSSYLPYENKILLHLANNADKPMRVRNNWGGGTSGSHVQFLLKDKAGKEITVYTAVFLEGVDYQRFVDIAPHSSKTIKYPLRALTPSGRDLSDVHTVEARCFISYFIPEKNIYDRFHKILSINTKLDLMIGPGYDSHAQNVIVFLSHTSNHEISVRNPSSAVKFELLNQQGEKFATRSYPFTIKDVGVPPVIKIAPKSHVRLDYGFSLFSAGNLRSFSSGGREGPFLSILRHSGQKYCQCDY